MPSRFSSFTRATWTVTATKWTTRNGVGGWRFIDAALSLTRRVLGATQRLQPALDEFNEMRAEKQTFITENGDDDGENRSVVGRSTARGSPITPMSWPTSAAAWPMRSPQCSAGPGSQASHD